MMGLLPNQLGVCSWSLEPSDPEDLVDKLRRLNLKNVQLALNPLLDNPVTWDDGRKILTQAGFNIVSGMFATIGEDYSTLESIKKTGGIVPDQHWDGNWLLVQGVARIAKQLGLQHVSFHAGFIPHDPLSSTLSTLLGRIERIAGLFADHGLTLLLETGQETAGDLLRFLDQLGQPNVGINFDPANMILYDKGDPIEALRKLLPRVQQVHIKDAVCTTLPGDWGTEVLVGDGQVDWPLFTAALIQENFRGGMMIEREAGDDRVADIRRAGDHVSQLMGKAERVDENYE